MLKATIEICFDFEGADAEKDASKIALNMLEHCIQFYSSSDNHFFMELLFMVAQESIGINQTFEFHRKLLDAFTDQKFLLEMGVGDHTRNQQQSSQKAFSIEELGNLILVKRFMEKHVVLLE